MVHTFQDVGSFSVTFKADGRYKTEVCVGHTS